MENLEKEKQTEKDLRIKLEDEYMVNTKNHEEEVKLRLKFEGKFNSMQSEHRELQIRHGRIQTEIQKQTKELTELGADHAKHTADLIVFKTKSIEQGLQIESLQEYKDNAEKELKKKNFMLTNAETARVEANNQSDLTRYQVQDAIKEMNDMKVHSEVQVTEI